MHCVDLGESIYIYIYIYIWVKTFCITLSNAISPINFLLD